MGTGFSIFASNIAIKQESFKLTNKVNELAEVNNLTSILFSQIKLVIKELKQGELFLITFLKA